MEIKGLDSFLSTSRAKKRKQLFDQRRQNEQRYEEMVERLLIRARPGWASDTGIAKSYGIAIIDKRPDDGRESKAAEDAQSGSTSTTISTIQRTVTAKKYKLSIQVQRRSKALGGVPGYEQDSEHGAAGTRSEADSDTDQTPVQNLLNRLHILELRDSVLRVLLRADSYARCVFFGATAGAVWYALVAVPYEMGWPERMGDFMTARELCRALYIADFLMTVLQASVELADVDDDAKSQPVRLETRIWLPLDLIAMLPYDAIITDDAWRHVSRLAMLIKVGQTSALRVSPTVPLACVQLALRRCACRDPRRPSWSSSGAPPRAECG